MSAKSEALSLGKMLSLCLCRPFPMAEGLLPLRHLYWSSLLPSPWDSPCFYLASALGGVCKLWICFQHSRLVDRSQGMQLQGHDQLCPPCREVIRETPGMYLILNLYAFDLHKTFTKPYQLLPLWYNFPLLVFFFLYGASSVLLFILCILYHICQ